MFCCLPDGGIDIQSVADKTRCKTHYQQLLIFYDLCLGPGSNRGPHPLQGRALPAELPKLNMRILPAFLHTFNPTKKPVEFLCIIDFYL